MLVCICLISCNFDGGNSNINNNSGSGSGNINNDPEKENIDYTIAEKLEGKTFSYFTQDVEAGDEAVLFKKSIGFGEIDKTSNTIALEIKDFKGTESNGIYDIKTNSIDGKVLDVTGLDKIREFDKEFTFDGLVYENCDENMKWAKLLEGNTYIHTYSLGTLIDTYGDIVNDTISIQYTISKTDNMPSFSIYHINERRQREEYYVEGGYKVTNLTQNDYILLTGSNDGNGSSQYYIKENN